MACAECGNDPAAFLIDGRELCGKCYQRLYPDRIAQFDQQAINKRVAEKKWLRMVDLPGYAEWSACYHGLDSIIPELREHHVLVHPDELSNPLVWLFEREFQSCLDDFADRGAPRKNLSEYKVS